MAWHTVDRLGVSLGMVSVGRNVRAQQDPHRMEETMTNTHNTRTLADVITEGVGLADLTDLNLIHLARAMGKVSSRRASDALADAGPDAVRAYGAIGWTGKVARGRQIHAAARIIAAFPTEYDEDANAEFVCRTDGDRVTLASAWRRIATMLAKSQLTTAQRNEMALAVADCTTPRAALSQVKVTLDRIAQSPAMRPATTLGSHGTADKVDTTPDPTPVATVTPSAPVMTLASVLADLQAGAPLTPAMADYVRGEADTLRAIRNTMTARTAARKSA